MTETIWTLLERAQARGADLPAILASGRPPLRYGDLIQLVADHTRVLDGLGLKRGDRIALVLENGPEAATAFLSVTCTATAAPLNPAYRADEFAFYLADLAPKTVLVSKGVASPVREVAAALAIPLIELVTDPSRPAGQFEMATGRGRAGATLRGRVESEDDALLLHTSGTTSRPKLVPLTHGNLVASAVSIVRTLGLTPEDRGFNIMPLFHIHGLVGCVLATIASGGSLYCAPGFNALKVFSWLEEAMPSWYSAVPTMHQAFVARAERNAEALRRLSLRFIRSSSAALTPKVMQALEATFRCPVIESYGMTEASHQMASNPLPPRPRKPGSVGLPAGPEIRIMGADGQFLPAGVDGEIVICGANVTRGYVGNPEANAAAFHDGWFRTGDQGRVDSDGYLFITGRLKELINRGGEKISPREIDEVLMDHPAVAQAVAFAVPHDKLGEEIAAAVVLRDGSSVTEGELRAFVGTRLADFKVPRRVVIVPEIPRGPTGKLQRTGLAKALGLAE